MEKYELNIYENAIDSLEEALEKFCQAQTGEEKAYKFVILHLVHSIELFFKHHVLQIAPELLFKKNQKSEKPKTITLWEAYRILSQNNIDFSDEFEKDLEYLTNIRNDIEHYRFTFTISDLSNYIGRTIVTLEEMASYFGNKEIEDVLNSDKFSIFKKIAIDYEKRKERATRKIEERIGRDYGYSASDLDIGYSEFPILTCPACGQDALIPNDASSMGWRCAFCEEDIPVKSCARCEQAIDPSVDGEFCQACKNYIDGL